MVTGFVSTRPNFLKQSNNEKTFYNPISGFRTRANNKLGGYQNKLVVMGSYQAIPVREAKEVNFYYGIKTGYEIKNFTPTVGYFFSKRCFKGLAYFLKYSVKISNGAVYIEAGRLEKNQITGGFQIDIK